MLIKILCILFAALNSTFSIAGIFGPSNYEECVTDIVKSGKNSNYAVAQTACRSQFPKLIKLSNKRDVVLACQDVLGKSVYEISFHKGSVSLKQLKDVKFETTSLSKEGITFNGSSRDKERNREVMIYGKINSITSDGSLIVEYVDKQSKDYVYEFTCTETN